MSDDRSDGDRLFANRVAAVNPLLAPDPEGRSLRQRLTERPGRKSPATLKRYLKKIREAGTVLALQKRPRKDKGKLTAFSQGLLAESIRLREENPKRITRKIVDLLRESEDQEIAGEAKSVCLGTLMRHLRQRGKTRRILRKKTKGHRRFERENPGDLYQFDYTDGPYLPDPAHPGKRRKTQICVGVDDHSRVCLICRAYWRGNWPSLEDAIRRAFSTWGLGLSVFVDNAKIFHCHEFLRILGELKVGDAHRTAHYPPSGGKIEALIGTMQEEIFPEIQRAGLEAMAGQDALELLNEVLEQFAFEYNRRPHTETGATPLARWEANTSHVRQADPTRLREAFWWVREPRVNKCGIISVNGVEYEIDLALVGQKVQARYDPFDATATVRVFDQDGKLWGAYKPRGPAPADNGRGPGTPDTYDRTPLASARNHVARLATARRGRIAELPVTPSDATHPELEGAKALIHLISSYLLRPEFTPAERQRVVACQQELVAVRLDVAEHALRALVARKGRDLHVERYLAVIKAAHREE
jgi:transposase InsO family protein